MAWDIAVVYADNDMYGICQLWEDISNHLSAALPHVVGSDFNCILEQGEKKGGKSFLYSQPASEMGDFMAANDLVDPGYSGPAFTWKNNKDARNRIYSRLDRFLVSSSILDNYQELRVVHLARVASDHCPILCSFMVGGRKTYSNCIKFEDVWTTFPRAWQIVSEKWKVPDSGTEAAKVQKKCRRTLKALFFWSRNKMDRLNKLKEDLYGEIRILQELECSPTGLTDVQSETLRYKVQLLKSNLARITTWWGQSAKVRWIEEGDENTHFFHTMASARRRGNSIEQLTHPNGQPPTEQTEIMIIIHGFFAQKWQGNPITESGWPSLDAQVACLDRVTGLLEGEVTREEVWNDVRLLGPNRAPRRDDITTSFFKAFWEIVGDQAAFVHGRSISDHCLLGQEIMNKFQISKAAKGWMAMKVDMEQAYDKMSWRTLELVLLKMGFPQRFRSWVLSCVIAPRFTILVNDMLTEEITAKCGFRQGCPLSPYLFILCSELLSLHFRQNYRDLGVQICEGGPLVSHLLYADDVLLFAGATISNVRKLLTILDDY
ncbi:uncharacterized protein LOC110106628 [Dendrobium catenatum]|uniref:uncharacterized protein LOC110106628 n=1 Tax=Dendrobium catenatum TaxID=906689 RepID=UPI0009F6D274|nr:uncharacterized protein LOC110106628 [Dendrobium catenatum]